MSAMEEYIQRSESVEKRKRLKLQWAEAAQSGHDNAVITSGCGQVRSIEIAFRCLYCGEWFCVPCAEKHFGQTIQEWIEAKRIAHRIEMQNNRKVKP